MKLQTHLWFPPIALKKKKKINPAHVYEHSQECSQKL